MRVLVIKKMKRKKRNGMCKCEIATQMQHCYRYKWHTLLFKRLIQSENIMNNVYCKKYHILLCGENINN